MLPLSASASQYATVFVKYVSVSQSRSVISLQLEHHRINKRFMSGSPSYVCIISSILIRRWLTSSFSFYSWRRYCNKHQIRLGGYAMDVEGNNRSTSPGEQNEPLPPVMGLGQVHGPLQPAVQGMQTIGLGPAHGSNQTSSAPKGNGPFTVHSAMRHISEQGMRNRSPTPPRALFRSTTGKGVAFTDEDVAFLCKMLAYRKYVLKQITQAHPVLIVVVSDCKEGWIW